MWGCVGGKRIPMFWRTLQSIQSIRSFETPGNTNPMTQRHIPRELNPFRHLCSSLRRKVEHKRNRQLWQLSTAVRHVQHSLHDALCIRTTTIIQHNICDLPTTSWIEISFCRTVGNTNSLNHQHDTTWVFKVMRAHDNVGCHYRQQTDTVTKLYGAHTADKVLKWLDYIGSNRLECEDRHVSWQVTWPS